MFRDLPEWYANALEGSPATVDQIAASVVPHLGCLLGAKVKITPTIEAHIPSGAADSLVRTVTENCRTLKFKARGLRGVRDRALGVRGGSF
jgi:hypothetical protein